MLTQNLLSDFFASLLVCYSASHSFADTLMRKLCQTILRNLGQVWAPLNKFSHIFLSTRLNLYEF